MLVKFKIASFRETDRIQESTPMYFTTAGFKSGKLEKRKVWDYNLTDTDGKEWLKYGQAKRGGFRKGQVITAETRSGNSLGIILTPFQFIQLCAKKIDSCKARIKIDEEEIARLRAL